MMLVEWIDSTGEFDGLRGEWNELLANSPSNCVFLTWEWLRTWWTHFADGRRLVILTIRDGGKLVGIAPLTICPFSPANPVPFRHAEFLGTGTIGSDYLDFIVRSGYESEVTEIFSHSLRRWKLMLKLSQVRGSSSSQAAAFDVAQNVGRHGWQTSETRMNRCPFIPLQNHTWESYLATLGSEHRYNVQRRVKHLYRDFNVAFEKAGDSEQLGPALDLLIELHRRRWLEHGDSDAFHTPQHVAFHRDFTALALHQGWLRLFLLKLDGNPVSALYGLRYGGVFHFYQSGFDPVYSRYSVGLATMALAIQHAISEGAAEYDFLHGEEEYKYRWTKQARDLVRLELYPPGVHGALLRAVSAATSRARALAKRTLKSADEILNKPSRKIGGFTTPWPGEGERLSIPMPGKRN